MSQIETVTPAMAPIIYRNTPCISTEQLANAYEVKPLNIQQNYANNKERFIEGKHYFSIDGKELTDLRNLQLESFYLQISPKARHITLWTERGAARHAKMLNSDKAWDMFELLEESFFRTAEKQASTSNPIPAVPVQSADAPITPDQQCTLQAIAKQRILAINDKFNGKGGALFPKLWGKFNNHFRLAKYNQLPQSKMSEAISYLMTMDIIENEQPQPALPEKAALKALPMNFSGIRSFFDEYDRELFSIEEKIKALDVAYVRNTNPLIQTVAKQIAHPFAVDAVIETMHLRQREITESVKSIHEKMHRQRQFLLALLSNYASA